MKFHVLCFFLVNILSILSVVSALSGDCILLNDFLGRDKNTQCCVNDIVCDGDGKIIALV
eukprot:jgi/Orpsp1_1/1184249/evm.model.c7180000088715.1